jgi:hypothetical protein
MRLRAPARSPHRVAAPYATGHAGRCSSWVGISCFSDSPLVRNTNMAKIRGTVTQVFAETATLLLAVFSIWVVHAMTNSLLGSEVTFVDRVSTHWAFDAAHLLVLARYVWRLFRSVWSESYEVAVDLTTGAVDVIARITQICMLVGLLATSKSLLEALPALLRRRVQQRSVITVAGLLAAKRAKRSVLIFAALMIAFVINWLLARDQPTNANLAMAVLLLILVLARAAAQWILAFRLRRGYFGSRHSEAREIVLFLLQRSVPIDIVRKNGWPAVLPQPEEVERTWSVAPTPSGETA